jgi:uncharacterized protein YwbE
LVKVLKEFLNLKRAIVQKSDDKTGLKQTDGMLTPNITNIMQQVI